MKKLRYYYPNFVKIITYMHRYSVYEKTSKRKYIEISSVKFE